MDGFARLMLAQPALGAPRKRSALERQKDIAFADAGVFGRAPRLHAPDENRAFGAAARNKAKRRARTVDGLEFEASATEDVRVGELVRAGDVAREELFEAAPGDALDRGADVGAVAVEPPALSEILVQVAQNVVQARAVVGGVADQD